MRSTEQRRRDTLLLLNSEVDLWVPSANERGDVHLIPLSFAWLNGEVVMATPDASITTRNLRRAGRARVAIGPTRDVVIIEGPLLIQPVTDDVELAKHHAEISGFDSLEQDGSWVIIRIVPERIQAWRNPAELKGRNIFGDGTWLDGSIKS